MVDPTLDSGEDSEEPRLKVSRKSPLARTLKLCPRCLTPLTGRSKFGGWLFPQDYFCGNCGYSGTVFLEHDIGSLTREK